LREKGYRETSPPPRSQWKRGERNGYFKYTIGGYVSLSRSLYEEMGITCVRRLLSRLVGVCLGRLVLGDGVDVNGVPLEIFPRSGWDDGIRLFVNSSCQCSL